MKKVKSDNENASLWCVLGETKAAQASQSHLQVFYLIRQHCGGYVLQTNQIA